MKFWSNIRARINQGSNLVLLYVLHSEGSSPGRQGFKMAVDDNGWMLGSIGGGFMEHKLVELARAKLQNGHFTPFAKRQIHRTNEIKDRSGMICSGEQIIAFYFLDSSQIKNIPDENNSDTFLLLDQHGLTMQNNAEQEIQFSLNYESEENWQMTELLNFHPKIVIVGAGHVGLALSKLMKDLGFDVVIIDDRQKLNTMEMNNYASKKVVTDYQSIDQHIPFGNIYLSVMSFGYRTDKLIITKLLDKEFKYFGVLGSKAKMKKLFEELISEGYDSERLKKIHTPIGLDIKSKTPMEIAVSIAAQIIKVKNQYS
ncbi:MAG: XdhC family protein [Saprospiraceae bacterium]|nr:XdhC family protein [Saprospiraceae bacterium]